MTGAATNRRPRDAEKGKVMFLTEPAFMQRNRETDTEEES